MDHNLGRAFARRGRSKVTLDRQLRDLFLLICVCFAFSVTSSCGLPCSIFSQAFASAQHQQQLSILSIPLWHSSAPRTAETPVFVEPA